MKGVWLKGCFFSNLLKSSLLVLWVWGLYAPVYAQLPEAKPLDYDTNYYHSYTDKVTTRLYSSVKYANFSIQDTRLKKVLRYDINNRVMLGLGANYSIFGLNIAFNLPFNKRDFDRFGETEYIDLQSHLYLRKYVIDLFLQRYKGMYLANSADMISGWDTPDSNYLRPDLRLVDAGLNVQYILNSKKFSYRAAYVQNEWQKRSAGSFIFGASAFYAMVKGDSSVVPTLVIPADFAEGSGYDKSTQFTLGVHGGYTQTFVAWQRFFLVIGLSAGPALGYATVHETAINKKTKGGISVNLNGMIRGSIGYNSYRFYVGFFYLNHIIGNDLPINNLWNTMNTGNFRFNLVYRFSLKKPIKWLNVDYWEWLNK
ncbi:MAG: DUF4421 domain-containing protein [Bacteroidales bacterium]|nr:DUF4421 domain-containing protein [Bacteroidales bacterium]